MKSPECKCMLLTQKISLEDKTEADAFLNGSVQTHANTHLEMQQKD